MIIVQVAENSPAQNGIPPVAQGGQMNNVVHNPAFQQTMAQAASSQSNAAQVSALLAPHMESLMRAAKSGQLSEEQRQQVMPVPLKKSSYV